MDHCTSESDDEYNKVNLEGSCFFVDGVDISVELLPINI